jgi:hypothetical protein
LTSNSRWIAAVTLAAAGRQQAGRIEVDDAYLGGERSGGKCGRG